MRINNTLSKKIEKIEVRDNKVSLYTCGPTVYDYAHIGNLRTFIFEDVLRRVLEMEGNKVHQVMNITDIDDKTIRGAGGKKDKFDKLTKKFEKAFFSDLKKLNVEFPEDTPRATAYIEQMVGFISDLLDKGFAYKGEDGSIYFSIEKFNNYGKLSNLDKDGIKAGARVSSDEYDKENPADFALWKAWDESDGEIFWDPSKMSEASSKLGKGRPGWHIECSVMSKESLGETVDIHAGGVDLIFPHHENEIAQSEAVSGKKFVNYWVHAEHLLVDGKKMSKSLNNFYKLSDLEERGYSPLDFRYLCLQSHYKSKLNFTWDGLDAAKNARARLRRFVSGAGDLGDVEGKECIHREKFRKVVADDLNTPEALAVVWEVVRDEKISDEGKYKFIKWADDNLLNLGLFDADSEEIPAEVMKLAKKRDLAKTDKKYEEADALRDEIEKSGYSVEDSSGGSKIVAR